MPSFSNVSLLDSFDLWRSRYNQVIAYLNEAFVTSNSVSDTSTSNIATANAINTLHGLILSTNAHAQTAHVKANTSYAYAQTAFDTANIAYAQAQTVWDLSVTVNAHAQTAHIQANTAWWRGQTAIETANTGYSTGNAHAQTAHVKANTAYAQAQTAFETANGAYKYSTSPQFANLEILTLGTSGQRWIRLSNTFGNLMIIAANTFGVRPNGAYIILNSSQNMPNSSSLILGMGANADSRMIFQSSNATSGIKDAFVIESNGAMTVYNHSEYYGFKYVGMHSQAAGMYFWHASNTAPTIYAQSTGFTTPGTIKLLGNGHLEGAFVDSVINSSATHYHVPSTRSVYDYAFGRQTIYIDSLSMDLDFVSPPEFVQQNTANGQTYSTLNFNPATPEYAHFRVGMPKSWNKGNIKFRAYWTTQGDLSNTVRWRLESLSRANGSVINFAYEGGGNVEQAGMGTANVVMITGESANITVTGMSDNAMIFFRVYRNADHGNDTMTVDAKLLGVQVYYDTVSPKDD